MSDFKFGISMLMEDDVEFSIRAHTMEKLSEWQDWLTEKRMQDLRNLTITETLDAGSEDD